MALQERAIPSDDNNNNNNNSAFVLIEKKILFYLQIIRQLNDRMILNAKMICIKKKYYIQKQPLF